MGQEQAKSIISDLMHPGSCRPCIEVLFDQAVGPPADHGARRGEELHIGAHPGRDGCEIPAGPMQMPAQGTQVEGSAGQHLRAGHTSSSGGV